MRAAFVVSRYGPDVLGGAETLARGLAEGLAQRGADVEIWTTCARDHYTWENVYPAGEARFGGLLVRRFPVRLWNEPLRAELETRLAVRGSLAPGDQQAWLESGAHSPALYAHLRRHARGFDVLIVLPYAQPFAHAAAWLDPDRVVFIPCLHDEPYAYMALSQLALHSVRGVVFNSPEEAELAERVGIRPRKSAVGGGGVELQPEEAGAEPPRHLLYVGRMEGGKNVRLLYRFARRYWDEGGRLRLVVLGGGPERPPAHPAFEARGFVRPEEKARAYGSALALCQPSLNESFSFTLMEAWSAGRPVLVHHDGAVTRGHVRRSQGGLWFTNYEEFAGAVEWLRAHPDLARRLGRNGREYVRRNYTWEAAAGRLDNILRAWGSG